MIIGFGGALGSGKDTAGRRLAQMVDMPSVQISFAAKLKASVAALFDVPVGDFDRWKNDPSVKVFVSDGEYVAYEDDENHLTGPLVIREFNWRQILQRYGTESHRDVFGQDFWVDQALNAATDPDVLYYVTDVRFDNEVDGVVRRGGPVVQVLTGNEPEIVERFMQDHEGVETVFYYDAETGDKIHPSEVPPNGFTRTLMNDVRNDGFANLDKQLRDLALERGLPLKSMVTV
jgi:hypothetical protein